MSGTGASSRGRLIALEGVDGCGKSTQAKILARRLGAILTYEPGDTDLGRRIRAIGLDDASLPIGTRAEALLMLCDRAQHVAEVIEPALASGRWVVSDRFSGSTLAYQGYGRGLDVAALDAMSQWAAGGVFPDLTVFVDVPPGVARARRSGSPDRLESEDDGFHDRVAAGFSALAAERPDSWVRVDGRPPSTAVAAAVLAAVEERFGKQGASATEKSS